MTAFVQFEDINNNVVGNVVQDVPVGATPVSIAAGTVSDTVVKATAGVLVGIVITTVGLGQVQAFDNASTHSGNVLESVPASAAVGLFNGLPPGGAKALNGITIQGAANNPAMIVYYY